MTSHLGDLVTAVQSLVPSHTASIDRTRELEERVLSYEANAALLNNIQKIQEMMRNTTDPVLLEKLNAQYNDFLKQM